MKWNLDPIFSGGSHAASLKQEIASLKAELPHLQKEIANAPLDVLVEKLQSFEARAAETEAFIYCLTAQDVNDTKALQLGGEISSLKAKIETANCLLDERLLKIDEKQFAELLSKKPLSEIAFYLQEKRTLAKEKLPIAQESLINDLSVDGYRGWTELYDSLVGKITIPFEGKELSVGQAANQLSSPDKAIRDSLFLEWEKAWQSQESLFAQTLNHISGFRCKLYEHRKWNDILKEPLFNNRMKRETLDAMWSAIAKHKGMFKGYLDKRASLLGVAKLSWADLEAPLFDIPQSNISFDKAMHLIIRAFEQLSPAMGRFAEKAFREHWIEAEDRPGKKPGGFYIHFPLSKTGRIFMTYSNTLDNLSTLAHELGHAYHSHAIEHLPFYAQTYRMNVAETASTLAEAIVADHLIKNASSKEEKRFLLDDKIGRAICFLMNIHARFLFEIKYYEKRKENPLLPQELNQLMEESQKEAFANLLEEWHPHFWASKMHFFFTDAPFYNFPYTFGYLFSMGIYSRLQKDSSSFAAKYDALLEDTGRSDVETLAKKHLDVDLTKPHFWEEGIALIAEDIAEF